MTKKVHYLEWAREQFPCPEGAHIQDPRVEHVCENCQGPWATQYVLELLANKPWSDATIAEWAPEALDEFDMELVFGIVVRTTGYFLDLSRSREEAARRADSSSADVR